MAPTFVFQYYNGSNSVITITTNTSLPVITETDPAASTTYSSVLHAATLLETVEYSTKTLYNFQSSPTATVRGTATTTSTTTGGYTIPLPVVLLPGVTSTVYTTSTSITSTTQPIGSATSSTSSLSSSASNPLSSSTGTSTPKSNSGEIAGAAVGCLVGGALIAGLAVWLFMSSRNKRHRSRGGFVKERHSPSNANREKSLPTGPLLAGAGAGWEQHLPQSESDGTIRTSVKALFDQIELHVENFYRNSVISISPVMQAELVKVDSSYLPDSIVGLLPQTKNPTVLIKHCLAQLIVSRITPDSDTSRSFLPADFVALPHAMSGTRSNSDKPAFTQALSRWRVLSYYLRPRPKEDHAYLSVRDSNITTAADTISSAFTPWATSLNELDARRRNLIEIMRSAADTGIMIFSQPSGFAYRWAIPSERDRRGLNRIVVVPGFAKVSDEHARDLPGRGQELVAAVIATL